MSLVAVNDKIRWKMESHFAFTKQHSLLYRAEFYGLGIQMEVHTPVKNGKFGEQRVYFFIDGDKREFKTEDELKAAVKELVLGGGANA